MSGKKTVIITGASGGIGSGLVERFLAEGYNVVATSREPAQKLTSTGGLVVLDGEISNEHTASQAVEAAFSNFGSIDALVNNAGIFLNKPFTDFTTEDCDALFSTNLLGFFHITQRTVMITKGGLNSATQNLAIEYANDGIRFNAVAPGVVDRLMHRNQPSNSTTKPVMKKATVKDIVDAVLYLAQADNVSGEILHVDGAAPARRW